MSTERGASHSFWRSLPSQQLGRLLFLPGPPGSRGASFHRALGAALSRPPLSGRDTGQCSDDLAILVESWGFAPQVPLCTGCMLSGGRWEPSF